MTAVLYTDDAVLLDFAADVGSEGAVAIEGARTRWGLGGPLEESARLLAAPSGIVEYVPEEMIVTVRAGTTVADLHAELAERGQWTALPERGGTVGGAVAVGQNDFRKPARGELRSAVLQVRYVSSEGKIVSGGGPTVKNVSGFDIPRLITGSLGTLGCIAEVILRTNPIPAVERWFRADGADPFALQRVLLDPGAILWDGTSTTIQLAGHGVDVEADIALLADHGQFAEVEAPAAPTGHRWSMTPAELRNLPTAGLDAFIAEVGVGIVHASSPQPKPPLSASVQLVHERMKAEFDPTNRLNPGRVVGVR